MIERATDRAQARLPNQTVEPDDIVVTAMRRGEAQVPAETEFTEDQIAAQGADSIDDLMSRLRPFVSPDGDEPVLLINGRPAGFDRSVLGYPPDALTRLAILKPEAAARYGAAPGRRVVNLVLKKHFTGLDADAGTSVPFRGGQMGNDLTIARTAVNGDTRWNVRAIFGRDTGLRKNARSISRDPGIYDGRGFVSALDGGEIDPALSLAAGSSVAVAAFPAAIPAGVPSIADFAATAGQRHPLDPNAYATLQSARRTMGLNIGATRPLGAFSVSLALTANSMNNEGLRGIPMASVVLPAGNPWSPFAHDVLLTRPLDGTTPLRANTSSRSLGGSLTVNGTVAGWQGSLGIGYRMSWKENLLETGIDIDRVQHLLDAGDVGFSPFGPWDRSLLRATRRRSFSDDLSARLSLQKSVIDLPAGPITLNLTGNATRGNTQTRQRDAVGDLVSANDISRIQANTQVALNVPIAGRGKRGLLPVGDLSLDLTAGWQAMSGSKPQRSYNGGFSWSPIRAIQFRGMINYQQSSPSLAELDGPVETTITRMFDYARQVVAEPLLITGGNPALKAGSRQGQTIAAMVRPLGNEALTFNVEFRKTVAKNMPSSFPELTPAIEAAFPGRVTRDAAGNLVSVDARSINIAHDTTAELSGGVALRFSSGAKVPVPGGGANAIQYTLSLTETYRMKSEMLIRAGLPVIDRLGGGSGQSRHTVSLQFGMGRRGMGASLNASWNSAAHIGDLEADPDHAFRIRPPFMVGVSAFLDPDSVFAGLRDNPLTKGWKISVTVQNLFNSYQHVVLGNGHIPAGYSHDEIDPVGRSLRLQIHKRF
ncbi:MAG: hypothetical protein V4610_21915 [Pseudomonadota bacterium]